MSFILDALKKSESDRQRQSGPSLFEVKVAPPRRALPIWAVAIAVLLGINAIVISWMLLRHGPAPQPAAAVAPAPGMPSAAAVTGEVARTAGSAAPGPAAHAPAPVADSPSAPDTAATAGPGAASGRSPAEPARSPGTASSTSSAGGASAAAPLTSPADRSTGARSTAAPSVAAGAGQGAAQPASTGNPSDYAPAVEPGAAQGSGVGAEDLPLYQQIVTSAGLPALHLDLHVFAQRPKDRFVMINLERLGEGDSLPNGVQVEAIRPDGVVLSYHGTRFLLPRN